MMQKTLFENENMIEPLNPAFCIGAVSRSTFYQGDCLVEMDKIADKSVDMILCDLPYGTTACKWDVTIPFEPLWQQYERIIKDNGAIVLFGSEPFASYLRICNIKNYRYDWIWDKVIPTGAITAKRRPMQLHEYICVFYKLQPIYNRQFTERIKNDIRTNAAKNKLNRKDNTGYIHLGGTNIEYAKDYDPTKVSPMTILKIQKFDKGKRVKHIHETQKPVELMEYLIKTYTNEGETVLDNCMGSGTTGVACKKSNRHFIGIEKDEKYFEIAVSRVSAYCG